MRKWLCASPIEVDGLAAGQQQIDANAQVGAQFGVGFGIDFQDEHALAVTAAPQGQGSGAAVIQLQIGQQRQQVRMRQVTIADGLDAALLARQAPAACRAQQPQAVLVTPGFVRGHDRLQRRFNPRVGQLAQPRKLVGQDILLQQQLRGIVDMLPVAAPAAPGSKVWAARRDPIRGCRLQLQATREKGAPATACNFRCDALARDGVGHKDGFAAVEAQRLAAVPHIAQVQRDALPCRRFGGTTRRFASFSHSRARSRCRLCPTRAAPCAQTCGRAARR